MTELTKFSQTNGKSLSKAKSVNKLLVATKMCGHESTLGSGNSKTSDVGNVKPWTAGMTSDAKNVKHWRPGTQNL